MHKNRINVNWSYWELDQYFNNVDLIIIGGGIIGLFSAYFYKKANKSAKVLVLERGVSPMGASSKNAGFACFGSISELVSDEAKNGTELMMKIAERRIAGLELLRKEIGDKAMEYKSLGGYELFTNQKEFEKYHDLIDNYNALFEKHLKMKKVFQNKSNVISKFGFEGVKGLIFNQYEGQINTGMLNKALMSKVNALGVKVLTGIEVQKIVDKQSYVELKTNHGYFTSKKVIVATNGLLSTIMKDKRVKPARAQVLITKPIKNLKIKGTFHYDEGYYYFRNINNRILFGGGRNLDFKGEETTTFAITEKIQNKLENILSKIILPNQPYEIEHRWAGIMGVGNEKIPIIEFHSKNVLLAVRMGGMGVAIGSLVGREAAKKML
ncbi:MAG: NAD(P)/FAD-dependent oxidoreductase [Bacteroidia bacterium]